MWTTIKKLSEDNNVCLRHPIFLSFPTRTRNKFTINNENDDNEPARATLRLKLNHHNWQLNLHNFGEVLNVTMYFLVVKSMY